MTEQAKTLAANLENMPQWEWQIVYTPALLPVLRAFVKMAEFVETLQDDECSNNFHQVKAHLLHKMLRGQA